MRISSSLIEGIFDELRQLGAAVGSESRKQQFARLEQDAISLAKVLERSPEDEEARDALMLLIPDRKKFITAVILADSGMQASATWDTILEVVSRILMVALKVS